MAKNLVVVESPAKAKTINKILGRNFKVAASYGHVRDLPKSKLGVDEENDFAPHYVTLRDKSKVIKSLRDAAKKSDAVYLAADPDREGESICFHVRELLQKETDTFHRVTFNEITAPAVKRAFENATELDVSKFEAQQARRILDRLVGYKLSPLLWRKVGRGLSAGRVQSVALKLIVEREREIQGFNVEEYWKITAKLLGEQEPAFEALANKRSGKKFAIDNESDATSAVEYLRGQDFTVKNVAVKPRKRNSPPPFITSTLQQDAFRRLGFPVAKTMRVAQKLYEGINLGSEGQVALITYMRTDSTRIADEAKDAAAKLIGSRFGEKFIQKQPVKRKAVKGAQEAHEAIRPNYIERVPDSLEGLLDRDQFRLYELIWKRFIASQMAPAQFEATTVDIEAGEFDFRATGSRLLFDGFLAVLGLNTDDADSLLPHLEEGQTLKAQDLTPTQHFTQPPARFSEAGLVKELESRGIGRPSTYSTIISTIINREYVDRENKRLKPTDLGIVVTDLLIENFHDLMDYEYTARLEEVLDRIEEGNESWVAALQRFNKGFTNDLVTAEEKMRNLKSEIEETDEICPECNSPVVIRWGRFGRFKACSTYPECKYSSPLEGNGNGNGDGENGTLGKDPESDKDVFLRSGPYGPYIQLGETVKGKGAKKPKRVSLPKGVKAEDVNLDYALKLLSLPRLLGEDPETGKNVNVGIGRFGPYIERDRKFQSLRDPNLLFTITLEEALEMLKKGGGGRGTIKELGPHPQSGKQVKVMKGRYGPYVTDGKINATIPKDSDPEDVTMDDAVEMLAKKAAGGGKKRGKKK